MPTSFLRDAAPPSMRIVNAAGRASKRTEDFLLEVSEQTRVIGLRQWAPSLSTRVTPPKTFFFDDVHVSDTVGGLSDDVAGCSSAEPHMRVMSSHVNWYLSRALPRREVTWPIWLEARFTVDARKLWAKPSCPPRLCKFSVGIYERLPRPPLLWKNYR